jgi:hypothetical protein
MRDMPNRRLPALALLAAANANAQVVLDIEPWPVVGEDHAVAFRAIATIDDARPIDVTDVVAWSIEPFEAGVFAANTLHTPQIPPFAFDAVVTADYDVGDDVVIARSPTIVAPTGGAGGALAFDGGNDIVQIPPSESLTYPGAGGWTLEAWVRPNTSAGPIELIVGQVSTCMAGYDPYLLMAQNGKYIFSVDDATGHRESLTADIASFDWTHLAGVYSDEGWMAFYIDGVLVGQQLVALPIASQPDPVMIGRVEADCFNFQAFDGWIDEVRIWTSVRTQDQIRTVMFIKPHPPGLAALWRFDAVGQTVVDESGNANHGVLGTTDAPDGADPLRVPSDAPLGPAPCPADINEDATLSILDFVTFQILFTSGHPATDCNADGAANILDFVCFQLLFAAGCD